MAKGVKKAIVIAVEAADKVPYTKLCDFQGGLKTLSEENYQKLRREIEQRGFSFAVHVWKGPDKKLYILDGHQRISTVKSMVEKEGFTCPPIPVNYVKAKSLAEAKHKLLTATSQYGHIEAKGLNEYLSESRLDADAILSSVNFAEINMDAFRAEFMPAAGSTKEVSFKAKDGSKELNEGDFRNFDHRCPKCGFGFSDAK